MIYPPLRIAIVFISILTCFAFIQSHTMHAPVSIKMYEFEIRTNWQGFAATKQPNRDRNEDNNDTNSIHTHFKTDIYKFKLTPTKGKKKRRFFFCEYIFGQSNKKNCNELMQIEVLHGIHTTVCNSVCQCCFVLIDCQRTDLWPPDPTPSHNLLSLFTLPA